MIYQVFNGPKNTTAQPATVTTSTSLKTLLQVKPLVPCKLIEWGISFDGSAAATPGTVELVEVDVAATVTAFVAADITFFDGEALLVGDPTTSFISVGVSASGYTSSAEGSVTTVRNLGPVQQMSPTGQFIQQFPLGQEPFLQAAKFTRIRVKFGTAVNALCYLKLQF
jgi:hypothetical protein